MSVYASGQQVRSALEDIMIPPEFIPLPKRIPYIARCLTFTSRSSAHGRNQIGPQNFLRDLRPRGRGVVHLVTVLMYRDQCYIGEECVTCYP